MTGDFAPGTFISVNVTWPLALAIEAYVAIGLAWASWLRGFEEGRPPRPDMVTRWYEFAALIAFWPLVIAIGCVAEYLGDD